MDSSFELLEVDEEKHRDAFLLEKYKKGQMKLEEICTLRVNGRYPKLHEFYSYLLLRGEVYTQESCGEIFEIALHENIDDFWKVIRENLGSDRILSFIRSCFDADRFFLQMLYEELTLEQVEVVAKHLHQTGVSYLEQVEFYLYWQEEMEAQSFATVRTLADLGALNLDELADEHKTLFTYLRHWRQEDV